MKPYFGNLKVIAASAVFALVMWGCGNSKIVVGRHAEGSGITPQEHAQSAVTGNTAKTAAKTGQNPSPEKHQSVLVGLNGGMMGMGGGVRRTSGAKDSKTKVASANVSDQPQSSPARPRPAPPKEEPKSKPGPAPYKLDLSFGGFGLGIGLFDTPVAIAVDDQENMYVVDQGNYRVQKFDRFGLFQFAFGRQGMGNGEFTESTTAPVALRMTG